MMEEPGKYDSVCTSVRELTQARGVILMVIEGNLGSGFSVQTTDPKLIADLPSVLRHMAYDIENTKQVFVQSDPKPASDG